MFALKLSALLALAAPLASALSITTPSGWQSSSSVNITWTAVNGDPQSFTVELVNEVFHASFGIANNVETGAMQLTLTLPVVPVGDGYTLQFVNPGNQSDIIAQTGGFSIAAAPATTSSSTTSSSSGNSSIPSTAPTVTPTLPLSSSGFGTTTPAGSTSGGSTSTGTGTGTTSSNTATGTTFNTGAAVALGVSQVNLASFAVMAVAAVAGAHFVGL